MGYIGIWGLRSGLGLGLQLACIYINRGVHLYHFIKFRGRLRVRVDGCWHRCGLQTVRS